MIRLSLMTLPPQTTSGSAMVVPLLAGIFSLATMLAAWRRGEYMLPGGVPLRKRERPGKFFAILAAAMAAQLFFTAIVILGAWSLIVRPG